MKFFISFGLAASVMLAACSSNQQTTTSETSAAPVSGASAMPGTAMHAKGAAGMAGANQIVLKAMNGSAEAGTATLTAAGKLTRVDLALGHEPVGAKQPAHIHDGSCAKLTPAPKYALKDVVGGKSSTIVNVSLGDLRSGKYAINVHQSAANLPKYVSCGDIGVSSMGK